MGKAKKQWKRGRGKLGFLAPLMGKWQAEAASPIGIIKCSRSFSPILSGHYIQLCVKWEMEKGNYEEMAIIGATSEGKIGFWSFTSDGKNSKGLVADVTDIHAEAIGFEAEMPAGLARMVYWPDEEGGYYWVVEAKNKNGWKRFTEHHYKAASS